MQIYSKAESENMTTQHHQQGLQQLLERLINKMQRDELIRDTIYQLRESLQVDRVVLYYFYEEWYGQVTFESLISQELSIFGSTGAENCFNYDYAALYLAGRTKAIADIELAPIETCHRDFLRSIQVRANLVVPVLTPRGLWGLLIAHQCHKPRTWLETEVKMMQIAAQTLATDSNILES